MKNRFVLKILIIFILLSFAEYFLLNYLVADYEKVIENIIQIMMLNVAVLAFYTWFEDNRLSNVELCFEFDKRWDGIIKIINNEYSKIEKKFGEKKADIEDEEHLEQLKLLIKTQNSLKFLLEKINYYENKNSKVKSYIDISLVVDTIDKSVELIFDTKKANLKTLKELLELYKYNLESIKKYIIWVDCYNESDKIKERVDALIRRIDDYISENVSNQDEKYTKLIATSVENGKYFKSTDESNVIFTSRNWKEKDDGKYQTWYRIPKQGDRSIVSGKDYYFIVRETDNNEFPYIYMKNSEIKKLVEEAEKENANNTDDSIHFYFTWDKNEYMKDVIDEKNNIKLERSKYKYELGNAQLRNGELFKKEVAY